MGYSPWVAKSQTQLSDQAQHSTDKKNCFSSVHSLSRVRLYATPWIEACQASLSITNSQSSLRLTPIESAMPSSHLILCCPLLLLPPIPPSISVFCNESTFPMRWPKYWSFSFSIIPSKEHPGLISFRMDWLDLLAVQGILKSLLQHHISKASILRHSAFFTVLALIKDSLSVDKGEGNGTPLRYSCLENPMDRGAWWAAVHGVAGGPTRLSDFTFTFHFHALERKWQSTPVFLPGESQGQGSLVGCHLWGRTESDMTEAT